MDGGKRTFKAMWAALAVAVLAVGCMNAALSKMDAESGRPVTANPIDVFVQSDVTRYCRAGLAVFPFESRAYSLDTGKYIAEMYYQELLQKGPFQQVKMISRNVGTEEEAIWWGRQEGCDLVMKSAVLYYMDGTGNVPTHLKTRVQILDVRTGKTLWLVEQKAYSEPGMDLEIGWATVSGAPAQRCRMLARIMANQFSMYLVEPLLKEDHGKEG